MERKLATGKLSFTDFIHHHKTIASPSSYLNPAQVFPLLYLTFIEKTMAAVDWVLTSGDSILEFVIIPGSRILQRRWLKTSEIFGTDTRQQSRATYHWLQKYYRAH